MQKYHSTVVTSGISLHIHLPSPPFFSLSQGVIGAGCAGLVCARELVREGHDVQVNCWTGHMPACMTPCIAHVSRAAYLHPIAQLKHNQNYVPACPSRSSSRRQTSVASGISRKRCGMHVATGLPLMHVFMH